MNPKKTLIFAVALAILAATYFLWDRPARQKKEQQAAAGEQIVAMNWDAVDRIELVRGGASTVFEKKNGEWSMTVPLADEADNWAVQALVSAIQHANPTRKLEQLPADYAKTFGLAQPRTVAKFTAGGQTQTVLIGNMNPVGETTYVQPQGANVVYLVAAATIAALDKSVDEMRRRELLAPRDPVKKLKQVKIEQAGEVPLTLLPKPAPKPAATQGAPSTEELPEDETWVIDALDGPEADAERTKQILDKLATLRAGEFIKNQDADLAVYGLDRPTLVVTATYGEGEQAVTKVLKVGKKLEEGNTWYVMVDGRSFVMSVDDPSLQPLRVTRADLRDHRLLPGLDPAKVMAIDLQTGETSLRITRSGEGWKLADGVSANRALIEDLLTAARQWRADELVGAPRAAALTKLVDGPQVITLTLFGAEDRVLGRLRLSAPADTANIGAARPKKVKKTEATPAAPAAPAKKIVVLVEGGYEGTVYLADPSVRDAVPTDANRLKAEVPAPAAAAPATPPPAPPGQMPAEGDEEE